MPLIVDILLEADPDSLEIMRSRVQALADKEDPKLDGVPSFVRLQKIPQLHFMSMQIFEDRHFDPLLVFENNFDGDPETYWQDVLAQIGDDLRGILACTKKARLKTWAPLFQPGSAASLVGFLQEHACSPSAQHFGAVGQTLSRIHRDCDVFNDIQLELGVTAAKYRSLDAVGLQKAVRQWALAKYAWLKQPDSPTTDQLIAAYKWSVIKPILPMSVAVSLSLAAMLALCFSEYLPNRGRPGARLVLRSLMAIGAIGLPGIAAVFWKSLRHLEESDFTQDDPELSPSQLKLFATQEDQIVQNHLASMVLVKPGAIRSFIIHVSLRLLKLIVPLIHSDGYLGSMRTIHFAHWTLVGNSGRLLFFSNFDGSWQSYLDDFVDKAASGLTLAWGNCVGFPRAKNLLQEGAARGTEFKAWARQSQTQSMLWYSAYPRLTVNQILRNAGIVDGLRKTSMKKTEAEQWAQLI